MVEISVVVPVFNVEKYLSECLDSIINQTFEDIEILCINDGSTDDSLNILEKYAKIDSRIKIINQSNCGLGATRNKGIDIASGKYIYFIDSDDYIELNTLMEMYALCETKKLDFAMCKVKNFDEKNKEFFSTEYFDMPNLAKAVKNKVFNYEDIRNIISDITVVAWNKLYNLNFIKNTNARFSENLIFEDNVFFWVVFLNANRIYFHQEYQYVYRIRDSSIMSMGNKNFIDTIEVHNQIFDIFKEYGLFDEQKKYLFNKKVSLINFRFNHIKEEYKETFFIKMKEDFSQMINEYDDIFDLLEKTEAVILNNITESDTYVEFILKNKLCQYNNDLEQLKSENKKLVKKNIKLKKKLKSCKQKNLNLTDELKVIQSSNSWKITKSLRNFRQNLKE